MKATISPAFHNESTILGYAENAGDYLHFVYGDRGNILVLSQMTKSQGFTAMILTEERPYNLPEWVIKVINVGEPGVYKLENGSVRVL